MKERFVKDFYEAEVGKNLRAFLMVKSSEIKLASNGKKYWDATLVDNTGELNCKKWDVTEDWQELSMLKPTDIIKIGGEVREYKGRVQISITRWRISQSNDNLNLGDFIQAAPEPAIDMYEYIVGIAKNLNDKQLSNLCLDILEEEKERIMYYPAAMTHHHAIQAGLLYHIKRMLDAGKALCSVYTTLNYDLIATGVIVHDIQKLNEMMANEMGVVSDYTFEGKLLGHIVMGIRDLDRRMERLGFDNEKSTMIQHMVLSHHLEPEFGSPKKPMFPEAQILHYLDVMDANMFDMERKLIDAVPGTFTEKIFTVNNVQMYKPKED
ncbi:MAG: OB-fold nucleic acid binding domain-containing protein [Eubacteriales bacterium]|nr:OB-fold nucleic acid binding domain-containing protein [Eubacteriales bacterium]MDY3332460.1 OB-fold nucleic acid binding domain-containing protein [Gallibacter sp.]